MTHAPSEDSDQPAHQRSSLSAKRRIKLVADPEGVRWGGGWRWAGVAMQIPWISPCGCFATHRESSEDSGQTIRTYHDYLVWIEKSIPRVNVRHHEACRVTTNSDPEGQIFLSTPNSHGIFFFLHTLPFFFIAFGHFKMRDIQYPTF